MADEVIDVEVGLRCGAEVEVEAADQYKPRAGIAGEIPIVIDDSRL